MTALFAVAFLLAIVVVFMAILTACIEGMTLRDHLHALRSGLGSMRRVPRGIWRYFTGPRSTT